jgi:hydroxymethylbilane synthase
MKAIKIGTRGSQLALYQANRVKRELEEIYPEHSFEIKIIKTKGDKILDVALSKIGDKGLFTKEIEDKLIDNSIDMAVHSLKDLPTKLPEKLCIGGVLKRGDVRDALVSVNGKKLSELTSQDIIATSSLRRRAQLLSYNSDFNIIDIRGNVNTRLQKMQDGYCTAMIMAAAGLQRLGLEDNISELLDPDVMIPAVAQGAIAIEIRENDPFVSNLAEGITDSETLIAAKAERIFLNILEGGCQVPVGCYSEIKDNIFSIIGFISDLTGKEKIKATLTGKLVDAESVAKKLAESFIEKGAKEILKNIRNGD